ncbi:tyrosine-type recombinase/integrase [Tessaracoccus massiliensis]|uniref:tyrosine-type recombinase/integrase n=1 Tax=Tessaracoccus massiliensis TaxID=1522311 RepID=UPI0005905E96|nr:site-specific integrase [Tessaracoccus massiliensis]
MAEKLPRGVSIVHRTRRGRQVKLYQVRVTWKGKRELVGRFDTLRDAKTAQLLAQADILRGVFIPPSAIRAAQREAVAAQREARLNAYKVRQLNDDWLDHLRRIGRKESTIYTYRKRIEGHILPEMGELPVAAITPQYVQEWFDALDAKHGNGVSRGAYMMLSGMFSYATGEFAGQSPDFEPIVERSPCRVAGATVHKPVRDTEEADAVISNRQIAALAEAMPEGEQLAVRLGGYMALRIGEVLGLQRRDVQGKWLDIARQLQSRGQGLRYDIPKTKAGVRPLPIPTKLQERVALHLERHVGDSPESPLFPRAERGDQALHPNVLRRHFNAALIEANKALPKKDQIPSSFVFHGLRHTCLTRLGESGATLEELKKFAGHSDTATVQRYQHATRQRLAALVG